MSGDLYETLGIPRDASAAAVTKAYRALAKRYHPDRNVGDDEAKARYEAVDMAYRVLSESERRAKYDATGEVDAPKPDNTYSEIMGVLSPVLFGVLKEIAKQGGKVKEEDVVHHMKFSLTAGVKELEKRLKELEVDDALLAGVENRFSVQDGEPNLFEMALKDHRNQIDARREGLCRDLERARKTIEFLKRCRYKADAKKLISEIPGYFSMSGSGTTGGGW